MLAERLWVKPRQDEDLVDLVGTLRDSKQPFEQVLTARAAMYLWYFLTRALFPEKGQSLTAIGSTANLDLPDDDHITIHIGVVDQSNYLYQIMGTMVGGEAWEVWVQASLARELWAALDLMLFPMGWQGREVTGTSS